MNEEDRMLREALADLYKHIMNHQGSGKTLPIQYYQQNDSSLTSILQDDPLLLLSHIRIAFDSLLQPDSKNLMIIDSSNEEVMSE